MAARAAMLSLGIGLGPCRRVRAAVNRNAPAFALMVPAVTCRSQVPLFPKRPFCSSAYGGFQSPGHKFAFPWHDLPTVAARFRSAVFLALSVTRMVPLNELTWR